MKNGFALLVCSLGFSFSALSYADDPPPASAPVKPASEVSSAAATPKPTPTTPERAPKNYRRLNPGKGASAVPTI